MKKKDHPKAESTGSFMTMKIESKNLVKTFLENNFGNPVKIPEDHLLYDLLVTNLRKLNPRKNRTVDYGDFVTIAISKENYRFDGYEMNKANTQRFNRIVDKFIRQLAHTHLDAALKAQLKQVNWKQKCMEMLARTKSIQKPDRDIAATARMLRREIEEHELNIKQEIDYVIIYVLKLNHDVLSYETLKKGYYRYRKAKAPTVK